MLRVEEGGETYLRRLSAPITVEIDGSEETLTLTPEKLKRLNEALKTL